MIESKLKPKTAVSTWLSLVSMHGLLNTRLVTTRSLTNAGRSHDPVAHILSVRYFLSHSFRPSIL